MNSKKTPAVLDAPNTSWHGDTVWHDRCPHGMVWCDNINPAHVGDRHCRNGCPWFFAWDRYKQQVHCRHIGEGTLDAAYSNGVDVRVDVDANCSALPNDIKKRVDAVSEKLRENNELMALNKKEFMDALSHLSNCVDKLKRSIRGNHEK